MVKFFRRPVNTFLDNTNDLSMSMDDVLTKLNHLLSLIILVNELVKGCGENLLRLVETMPKSFSTLIVDCLHISPRAKIPASVSSNDPE